MPVFHYMIILHGRVKQAAAPCDFCKWYNRFMLPDLQLDDLVRLRKPHPCGGYEWKVIRLGADIGLECRTCGRRVLLTRRELARRLKTVLFSGNIGSDTRK